MARPMNYTLSLVIPAYNEADNLPVLLRRLAEIVECRFFAGYSEKEIAQALNVGERTVQRDWALARAWLQKELGNDASRIG